MAAKPVLEVGARFPSFRELNEAVAMYGKENMFVFVKGDCKHHDTLLCAVLGGELFADMTRLLWSGGECRERPLRAKQPSHPIHPVYWKSRRGLPSGGKELVPPSGVLEWPNEKN